MALFQIHKEEPCWGIWKMEESEEELARFMPQGSGLLEEARQHFANANRRREWLAVRALLFSLLGEAHEIAYHPSGKPYLKDGCAHISISHTKGYVAVALHPHREVGIDIEQYATRALRLKERFMHAEEKAEGDEVYASLLHWSAKETLFKLLGQEEVNFKEHLRIQPFTIGRTGVMSACEHKTSMQHRYSISYLLDKDFVLTWCVGSPSPSSNDK